MDTFIRGGMFHGGYLCGTASLIIPNSTLSFMVLHMIYISESFCDSDMCRPWLVSVTCGVDYSLVNWETFEEHMRSLCVFLATYRQTERHLSWCYIWCRHKYNKYKHVCMAVSISSSLPSSWWLPVCRCFAACIFEGQPESHDASYTESRCNTLQHTATHCSTLQHTAAHCNTLQHTATHCSTLQHTAAHCNTQQDTATHCNWNV